MIRTVIISFCFGALISRGVKFGDAFSIVIAIAGFFANLLVR